MGAPVEGVTRRASKAGAALKAAALHRNLMIQKKSKLGAPSQTELLDITAKLRTSPCVLARAADDDFAEAHI